MPFQYFTVSVDAPEETGDELNRFVASHRVVSVRHELVTGSGAARWVVVAEYLDTASPSGVRKRSARIDYREVLNPTDFAVFAELRIVRKALAADADVPPYAVFTDAQLAAFVTGRAASVSDVAAVDGVGEAKQRDFAPAVLARLRELQGGAAT